MEKIVRVKIYNNGNLINNLTFYDILVSEASVKVRKDYTERGDLIETYYVEDN